MNRKRATQRREARERIPTLYNQFMVWWWSGRWVISGKMLEQRYAGASWETKMLEQTEKPDGETPEHGAKSKITQQKDKSRLPKITSRWGLGLIGKLCYYRNFFLTTLHAWWNVQPFNRQLCSPHSLDISLPSFILPHAPETAREENATDENVFPRKLDVMLLEFAIY